MLCKNNLSKLFMVKANHLFQYPNTLNSLLVSKFAITPNRKDWYIYSIENKKWIKIFSGELNENTKQLILNNSFTFESFMKLTNDDLYMFYNDKNKRFDFNNIGFLCFIPNIDYSNYSEELIFLIDSKKKFNYATKSCVQEIITIPEKWIFIDDVFDTVFVNNVFTKKTLFTTVTSIEIS